MFYAASALLAAKGLGAAKHSGVLALIDKEFVHTGALPAELSRRFRDAFLLRQQSDYAALRSVPAETAQRLVADARSILGAARALLAAEPPQSP